MSRNCLMPASAARKRTARARNARLARTENTRFGYAARGRSPSSPSASKWSVPPQPVVIRPGDVRDAGVEVWHGATLRPARLAIGQIAAAEADQRLARFGHVRYI